MMRAVFLAPQAIRYYDATIPTMDKIYYLLSSQPILNDKELFGPMNGALCDGVNNKLGTVFGESSEEEFPCDN